MVIDDEPYVRSPQRIEGDEMYFYCNVMEGVPLNLLEASDIIQDTRDAVESKKKELPRISGMITFNCILRTLELKKKGGDRYPYRKIRIFVKQGYRICFLPGHCRTCTAAKRGVC